MHIYVGVIHYYTNAWYNMSSYVNATAYRNSIHEIWKYTPCNMSDKTWLKNKLQDSRKNK